VWVECSAADAQRVGLTEGDLAEIRTARGIVQARVRITGVRDGVLFLPFHYGYWDRAGSEHRRAANELTPTEWDPVSKQPIFKTAAATLIKVPGAGRTVPAQPARTRTGAQQ
jgi:anaerobic selenocysteine-containing dehydrogenase